VNVAVFMDADIKDVLALPSKVQKQKKAEQLNQLAIQFYKEKLIPTMHKDISSEINKEISVTLSKEERTIYVSYPCIYKDVYINSSVKLEIGPLENDYFQMRKMIFGDAVPEFQEVLGIIKLLEDEINQI